MGLANLGALLVTSFFVFFIMAMLGVELAENVSGSGVLGLQVDCR
jgi:hypothetical protein